MYRIMIARNGRYYGQKRTLWGNWTRCTDFFFSRTSCRATLQRLKYGRVTSNYPNPVEYV